MSIVHYLWEHIGVDVPPAKVAEYWSHNRKFKVPWAENHPAGDYHIPLALYGDSCRTRQVSYQPARKVLGIFLSCPLFRPKSVRASRWLVFSIEEDQLQGDITLDRVLLYIAWALNCLFTGRWPRCDMKGTEFTHHKAERAGKWICGRPLAFALTELRGDWLWFKGLFRLRSSWKITLVEDSYFLPAAGQHSLQAHLDAAYSDFRAFCRTNKIACSQPPFTVKLVIKNGQEIMLTAKAYNNRVICAWLAATLEKAQHVPACDDRIPTMFVAMLLACIVMRAIP
ncbi:unnamed protein product [Durusdinium trenchii]|uniref:Uncharacterized protein n=1 Tax=Durusdinium trenchii TaxID=1381693 RepID=A0ABP0PV02_9DINO